MVVAGRQLAGGTPCDSREGGHSPRIFEEMG